MTKLKINNCDVLVCSYTDLTAFMWNLSETLWLQWIEICVKYIFTKQIFDSISFRFSQIILKWNTRFKKKLGSVFTKYFLLLLFSLCYLCYVHLPEYRKWYTVKRPEPTMNRSEPTGNPPKINHNHAILVGSDWFLGDPWWALIGSWWHLEDIKTCLKCIIFTLVFPVISFTIF